MSWGVEEVKVELQVIPKELLSCIPFPRTICSPWLNVSVCLEVTTLSCFVLAAETTTVSTNQKDQKVVGKCS